MVHTNKVLSKLFGAVTCGLLKGSFCRYEMTAGTVVKVQLLL